MKNNYFSISETAKLSNVTRQTLIYYDKKGILKPALIDENKYRYYTMSQIDTLKIINMLKIFGTPLKTIKKYIDNKDKEGLLNLLEDLKTKMELRIREARSYVDMIEYKKKILQKSIEIIDADSIFLEMKDPISVYCGKSLTYGGQNGFDHFNRAYELEKELQKHGIVGLGLDSIVKKELITRDYNDQISYFCVPLNPEISELKITTIPGGLYVSAYNKGVYSTSKETYLRLIDYIENNDLIIDGDSFEVSMTNSFTEIDVDNYLLKISIKVKKEKKKNKS